MASLTIDPSFNPQSDLEWYNVSSLRTMLRYRSDRYRDARSKSDIITMLIENLFDPASVRDALTSADPIAREALALLKQKGGAMPIAAITGQLATWHPDEDATRIQGVPSELVRRALAFWHIPSPNYRRTVVHDIQRPSAENVHSVMIFSVPGILEHVAVPAVLGDTYLTPLGRAEVSPLPTSWQRDVLSFLRAIESRSPKILQSGLIGSRDRAVLAQAVGLDGDVPGAPRLSPVNFYRSTLGAAGILEVSGDRQLRTASKAMAFVSLSPARQAQALLKAWLESGENELLALGHLHCERHGNVPRVLPDVGQLNRAHQRLIDFLGAKAQPGQWYEVADVSRAVRHLDVEFLVSWLDPSPYGWSTYNYLSGRDQLRFPSYPGVSLEDSRGRSRSLVMGADWDLVEGAFIRSVFHGALTWLGLVECQVRSDGKEVFAITPLGAQALELDGTAAPPDLDEIPSHTDALIVQPNFDVVVYAPDERTELVYHIDRFAERVSVDRLAIYRLSNESVCAGLQLGLHIEDIIGLLESAARAPLPQNVAFSLRDWARRFEAIHWIRNAWLIEAPDAATLDHWLTDARVRRAVERRVSPTIALCRGERPVNLPSLLTGLGADVRMVDANSPLIPCGYADGGAGLVVPHGDLNLFLRRAVDDIAEYSGEDPSECRFTITRSSIERAVKRGQTSVQIMALIETVIQGRVPGGMRARVNGWAGAYGSVALGQVGIFVAPSPEAFRDLRADPAFAPAFILSVSPTAAIVDLDALEDLAKALAERGVTTKPYDFQTVRLS